MGSYGLGKGLSRIKGLSKANGWKVGDRITNNTKAGNRPSWSTVKGGFWKNQARYHPKRYSQSNLDLMRKGKASLVKYDLNGKWYPMELHHLHGRLGNNFWMFKPMTPWNHSIVDTFRHWRP